MKISTMLTAFCLAALTVGSAWGQNPAWSEAQAVTMLGKLGGAELLRDRESHRVTNVSLVNVAPTNAALALTARLPTVVDLKVVATVHNNFDDRGLAYVARMTQLEELKLVGSALTDRGVAGLADLTNLEQLVIDAPISDPGLEALRAMARLRLLDLSGTRVRGPGLANLAGMEQLEFLALDETPLGSEGLEYVGGLSSLRTLLVRGARIDDRGLAELALLPNLQQLYLNRTAVTEQGLANLAGTIDPQLMSFQGPTQLRRLSLREAPNLRGDDLAGLANLYGLPFFQQLDLQGTPLARDRERLARLQEAERTAEHWRQLQGFRGTAPILRFDEDLNLIGIYYVAPAFEPSPDAMDELANYPPPQLRELSLRDAYLDDPDKVEDLSGLTELRKLNLYNTRISDEGLTHLYGLENLEALYLDEGNNNVTPEGLDALREAIPGLEVVRLP
jgi:internalin A